jgi:hypothetical protein
MKRLFTILALLISFAAMAQQEPPKGANWIIISTKDSSHVAFKKLALLLQDAGYSLEQADRELGSIATGYKPQSPNDYNMALIANIREGETTTIRLQGKWKFDGAMSKTELTGLAINKGVSFHVNRLAFDAVRKLAESYAYYDFISYEAR